jgi:polyisoprenoid-binding protein YceI
MATAKRLLPLLLAGAALAARVDGQELAVELEPAQTQVAFTLGATLHTVHGAFDLRRGTVSFNPATGKASGEIIVDAASGVTDNTARDERMHKSILESGKFPDIIFRPDHIEGQIPATGSTTLQVHGMFTIHGASHEMTIPIQAQSDSDRIFVTLQFQIPYVKWGLKNPSTFLLRVSDQVQIEIHAAGHRMPNPHPSL